MKNKKHYFIGFTVFLSVCFFGLKFVPYHWYLVAGLGMGLIMFLFFLVFFSFFVKTKKNLLFSSILPVTLSLSLSLFYFLFLKNVLWQTILLIIFSFGFYTSLLTENVFLISAEIKKVPLYRAALTVSLLLTLLVNFFIIVSIFSFRLPAWENALIISGATLPLMIHFFWSLSLNRPFNGVITTYSVVFSLIIGEIAFILSFWPAGIIKNSLYLVSWIYILNGLFKAVVRDRLFKEIIREFILLSLGIFLGLFLVTDWR